MTLFFRICSFLYFIKKSAGHGFSYKESIPFHLIIPQFTHMHTYFKLEKVIWFPAHQNFKDVLRVINIHYIYGARQLQVFLHI